MHWWMLRAVFKVLPQPFLWAMKEGRELSLTHLPCGIVARTHGNRRALRCLPSFRFQNGPRELHSAAPRAELRPTPRSVGGCPRARGRLLPSRGHRGKDELRAGTPSSAPAPPVALPRARNVLPGPDGTGGGSGCRSLTPPGSLCPLAVAPIPSSCNTAAHRAWGCHPAISSLLLIGSQHASWATIFSCASHDELSKAPDPRATSWFKVISWWRQLESPPARAPLPSAHFGKALPVESGREDAAACPVLRWYPDHLSSKTPLQLRQSQGSPPVPGPLPGDPPAPPRVLRITSAVSSRGICRHRQCHPHASLLGTGSICSLTNAELLLWDPYELHLPLCPGSEERILQGHCAPTKGKLSAEPSSQAVMVSHAEPGWDVFFSLCDTPVNHIGCPSTGPRRPLACGASCSPFSMGTHTAPGVALGTMVLSRGISY
ncbi:uncharacterized protein LOC120512619 isoform X1 [Passer montanus]|uniref:uncharacterized protein LOC120512619 isoform X1 n=1 Tax=Passer montanus TaxID=9160 RepID=UPI001961A522|nr:uncharacterized protein LOC120512619 isoform X1 [Passer montanus]